jgi:class 3 adenylate cyclase/tetratricopeptide (TPR) repeat protein
MKDSSRCRSCGEGIPARFRFCGACGTPVVVTASRELRKTITALFCDVTGWSALGERLDPESLRRVMERYFDEMRGVLERHGACVEKFIGDAVMAVFGVPVLHEDDALRAVRAAVEMRTALDALNESLERGWGVRLTARIGVNTGEVVTGDGATGQSFATGAPVVLAQRLEQAARPGEILVGDSTYELVHAAVRAERVQGLALKGRREPLDAWRVLRVVEGASGWTRRLDAQLVGRRRELEQLHHSFDRAVASEACHLFTLLGAPGIGKSRLVREFLLEIESDACVLRGACPPYGEGITFWPVREAVRQATGEYGRAGIERLLAGEDEAARIAERVAAATGFTDPHGDADETFWALRRFLEIIARKRGPLVLALDDLHWAQPTFLDFVDYLADWSRDIPMLVLCLARPDLLETRAAWGGGKLNATTLSLDPLSSAEAEQLLVAMADGVDLRATGESITQKVMNTAEGNPLFIEQMLALLAANGGEAIVPPTIQALLAARIDRLQPDERAVVERASVVAKVWGWFSREALAELVPAGPDLDGTLAALVRKELIRPDAVARSAYRFRHGLIADAAYAALPKEERATLHASFADWLITTPGGADGEYDEIVGYHLEQAYCYRRELAQPDELTRDLARRAAERLAAAGRRAIGRADVDAAITLLRRATALAPGDLTVLPTLGAALVDAGRFDEADGLLADAVERARACGDRETEWRAFAERLHFQLDSDRNSGAAEIRRGAERSIAVFEELEDHAYLSKAWRLVGGTHLMQCRAAETEEAMARALLHAGRADDESEQSESLRWLVRALLLGPTPVEDCLERCRAVLSLASGSPLAEAGPLVVLGCLEGMSGRFRDARAHVACSRAVLGDFGLRFRVAQTAFVGGRVELLASDAAAAEREFRAGYDLLHELRERSSYLPIFTAFLGLAVERQGRTEEALRLAAESERYAAPDELGPRVLWTRVRARATHDAALAREAVALSENSDFLWDRADALVDLAELTPRQGERRSALERALELYEAKGVVPAAEGVRVQLDAAPRALAAAG